MDKVGAHDRLAYLLPRVASSQYPDINPSVKDYFAYGVKVDIADEVCICETTILGWVSTYVVKDLHYRWVWHYKDLDTGEIFRSDEQTGFVPANSSFNLATGIVNFDVPRDEEIYIALYVNDILAFEKTHICRIKRCNLYHLCLDSVISSGYFKGWSLGVTMNLCKNGKLVKQIYASPNIIGERGIKFNMNCCGIPSGNYILTTPRIVESDVTGERKKYCFVGWSDGVTENIRSFYVGGNDPVKLTALYEPYTGPEPPEETPECPAEGAISEGAISAWVILLGLTATVALIYAATLIYAARRK